MRIVVIDDVLNYLILQLFRIYGQVMLSKCLDIMFLYIFVIIMSILLSLECPVV